MRKTRSGEPEARPPLRGTFRSAGGSCSKFPSECTRGSCPDARHLDGSWINETCSRERTITTVISLTGMASKRLQWHVRSFGTVEQGLKAYVAFSGDSASCSGLCRSQLKCSTMRKTAVYCLHTFISYLRRRHNQTHLATDGRAPGLKRTFRMFNSGLLLSFQPRLAAHLIMKARQ